nr:immunoglobulin light chain junction region [Macaca mulatta]
CQKGNNWPWTF